MQEQHGDMTLDPMEAIIMMEILFNTIVLFNLSTKELEDKVNEATHTFRRRQDYDVRNDEDFVAIITMCAKSITQSIEYRRRISSEVHCVGGVQ